MKTNAIIRIIIWSVVIVLLLGILGTALQYHRHRLADRTPAATMVPIPIDEAPISTDPTLEPSGSIAPTITLNADDIQELEIEWVAGTITIQPDASADTIQISEDPVDNQKYQMVCKTRGNKLSIQFSEESVSGFGIHFGEELTKNLTILVPIGWECDSLEIDAAAADLEVRDLTIREVEFDGASGVCDFDNCIVDTLDIDTASGDIHFFGSLEVLDCDAVSASFYGNLITAPRRIDMDGMSGDLDLSLPAGTGFSVKMDGLSGNFTSEFETTTRNGTYLHGDGQCQINIDGVSGDVIIRKSN